MSDLLRWLAGGDLRSDGMAGEVARWVLENPEMLRELLGGLTVSDDVVRGRTADALEKFSRERPELLKASLRVFERSARLDPVPMVRWHMAMVLTNMAAFQEYVAPVARILCRLLKDDSAFVRSWAIAGLCAIGRAHPKRRPRIVRAISALRNDRSTAVRVRAGKAIALLLDDRLPLPPGWVKGRDLQVG